MNMNIKIQINEWMHRKNILYSNMLVQIKILHFIIVLFIIYLIRKMMFILFER